MQLSQDDSNLAAEIARTEKRGAELGADAVINLCITHGLNRQATWRFVRTFMPIGYRAFLAAWETQHQPRT